MNGDAATIPGGIRRLLPVGWFALLAVYQIALPLLLVVALPGWLVRMMRRGGQGSGLAERLGLYSGEPAWEPCGAVHVHAISVGEAMLALRLIRAWKQREPERRFVLATGTATGHAVAVAAGVEGLRVTYAPLDVPTMVWAYLRRFEPERLVLVEGEVWPNLMSACRRRGIPVSLVNARMSPRSERRYRKFAPLLRPVFSRLSHVALQEESHRGIWVRLGVDPGAIHLAGSLKFDPGGYEPGEWRSDFGEMIDSFGSGPRVLAVSTHANEEAYLARAIHEACPGARMVIVPRHVERAADAANDLTAEGFHVVRRSVFPRQAAPAGGPGVLLVDTTGELRDWMAHADVALIGKSFLSHGGQSPAEAILADVPVIFGGHMENFEPLAGTLVSSGGALRADSRDALVAAISSVLEPDTAGRMVRAAHECLRPHEGAIGRVIDLVS